MERIGHASLPSSAVGDPQVLTSPWRLLDLCFPLWLCRQDEGTFVANTAKCGPAAGSLPGMTNSCSEQMNKTLQCWRGAEHMGRRGQRMGNWNRTLVVGKSLKAQTPNESLRCTNSHLGFWERFLLKIISTYLASGGERGPPAQHCASQVTFLSKDSFTKR